MVERELEREPSHLGPQKINFRLIWQTKFKEKHTGASREKHLQNYAFSLWTMHSHSEM